MLAGQSLNVEYSSPWLNELSVAWLYGYGQRPIADRALNIEARLHCLKPSETNVSYQTAYTERLSTQIPKRIGDPEVLLKLNMRNCLSASRTFSRGEFELQVSKSEGQALLPQALNLKP